MRSLYLLFLSASLLLSAEAGFVPLFDGNSLKGWQLVGGHGPGYVIEDGKIVCPEDGGGNLFTGKQYSDFVLRFEFRLTEGGNNGIGIRAPLEGDAAYQGMEIQVLDDPSPQYRDLKPAQYHGSIYDVFPAERGHLRSTGEWNSEEITADGRRVTVKLNGAVIVNADLDTMTDPAVLRRHPGLARSTGHIGFLGHGTRVEFRNIRIRELR